MADPLISDVPAIHAAFKECGAGGKIVLPEGNVYAINELLTMEGCVQVTHVRSFDSSRVADLVLLLQCVVEFDGIFRQSANISQIRQSRLLLSSSRSRADPLCLPSTVETQTFFVFQNKSTSILLKGAKGAYIYSPAGTGGFEGNGQICMLLDEPVSASGSFTSLTYSGRFSLRVGGQQERFRLGQGDASTTVSACGRGKAKGRWKADLSLFARLSFSIMWIILESDHVKVDGLYVRSQSLLCSSPSVLTRFLSRSLQIDSS